MIQTRKQYVCLQGSQGSLVKTKFPKNQEFFKKESDEMTEKNIRIEHKNWKVVVKQKYIMKTQNKLFKRVMHDKC